MIYKDRLTNKEYEVEDVPKVYGGAIINVNGTSITDCGLMGLLTKNPFMEDGEYTVFCDSDEVVFHSFEDAYIFATTKQKNTFSL